MFLSFFLNFLLFNMQLCKLIWQEVNSEIGKGCTHTVGQSVRAECIALQQEAHKVIYHMFLFCQHIFFLFSQVHITLTPTTSVFFVVLQGESMNKVGPPKHNQDTNMLDGHRNILEHSVNACHIEIEAPEKSTSLNYMLLSARLAKAVMSTT